MSVTFLDLNTFDNENSSKYSKFYQESLLNFSNISTLVKSDFARYYHFLCKRCKLIPGIKLKKNNKIQFICDCGKLELHIKQVFEKKLFNEKKTDLDIDFSKILKCSAHPNEKYILYCKKCQLNRCPICAEECFDNHKNKIKFFVSDKKTNDKRKYIYEKILEKNQSYISEKKEISLGSEESNNKTVIKLIPKELISINNNENDSEDNIENDNSNDDSEHLIFQKQSKNNLLNNKEKEDINKVMDNVNDDCDEEFYYINLFSTILDDCQNYPNNIYEQIISEVEKFVVYYFEDYNEINLEYEFNEENVIYNSFELFGELFVNENKERCFPIINEKMSDLK